MRVSVCPLLFGEQGSAKEELSSFVETSRAPPPRYTPRGELNPRRRSVEDVHLPSLRI